MESMNAKERILKAMHQESTDRPPCICPGGMMNMITTDLMDEADISWPEAHLNARMMADLAEANYRNGCFENVGVPFCMTIEAESMGAQITMGSKIYEPHVTGYAINSVKEWKSIIPMNIEEGRVKVVLDAIRILKTRNLEVPIIGNITGPVSTASSVMEPTVFYKELRRNKEEAHCYMKFVTDEIIKFAKAQVEAGADIIAISDPSGTGEILGPKLFEEYTVKYNNMIWDALPDNMMGKIMHICGQMKNVYPQAELIHSDVLSFDSCVAMRDARAHLKKHALMGNVSTWTLEFGHPEKVEQLAVKCWKDGSNIISPACGLGTKSPLTNIQAIRRGIIEKAKNQEEDLEVIRNQKKKISDSEKDKSVNKKLIVVHKPMLEDQTPFEDQIQNQLPVIEIPFTLLRELHFEEGSYTAVIYENADGEKRLIALEKDNTTEKIYKICIDTEKAVKVVLINMHTGEILAESNMDSGWKELEKNVLTHTDCEMKCSSQMMTVINRMIADICNQAEVEHNWIYKICIKANFVMTHLLFGVNAWDDEKSQYVPKFFKMKDIEAAKAGIHAAAGARLLCYSSRIQNKIRRNTGKIRDFKCTYRSLPEIDEDVIKELNLTFPEAYMQSDMMVKLAKELKKKERTPYCELPFCHTVEAEAMGGNVQMGNGKVGPRAGDYIGKDIESLLSLPKIDFAKGRIHEGLIACRKLREQGEHVVFDISGPFTILNVLVDSRYIFKGMRRQPEVMRQIFGKLGNQILEYMFLAQKYGADMISYADSSGGVNILGPQMMEDITVNFTYPLLKEAEKLANDNTLILLCPKTTLALLGTGKAELVDYRLNKTIGYAQACIDMVGKVKFAGQMCIRNVDYQLNNGIFKEVKLL